jgi:hypothetical protein
MESPMRNNTLIMIEPVIEALTIVTRPARRAKMAIMNSIALPKVAFIRADTVLDTRWEITPVASTIRWEMATIAAAEVANEITGGEFKKWQAMEIGTKTSK